MSDYAATPMGVAFWKLRALPEQDVLLERVTDTGVVEEARWHVTSPAEIVPQTDALAIGLYRATSGYYDSQNIPQARTRYYLLAGRFSLLALDDALGSAIEAAIHGAAYSQAKATE